METQLTPIDKPHYRFFQAIYGAFIFRKNLYLDVALRWKGLGLLYVLFVLALAFLPFSLRLVGEFRQAVNHYYLSPLATIPPLPIVNGHLVFTGSMPYLIRNDRGVVIAAIDTTGFFVGKTRDYPDLLLLIESRQLTIFQPSAEHFIYALPVLQRLGRQAISQPFLAELKMGTGADSPQVLEFLFPTHLNQTIAIQRFLPTAFVHKINAFFWMILACIYPCVLAAFSAIFFPFILVFGMMGQLLARLFFQFKISYAKACRLFALASTALLMGVGLSFLMGMAVPQLILIGLVMTVIYFFYGVFVLKRQRGKLVLF